MFNEGHLENKLCKPDAMSGRQDPVGKNQGAPAQQLVVAVDGRLPRKLAESGSASALDAGRYC